MTVPLDRLLFRCRCRCCCFWVRRTWQREMSEARQWAETLAYQKAVGKAASLSSFVFVSLALTSSKPPPAAADWPLRKRRFPWARTLSSVHVSWFPTPPGRASGALCTSRWTSWAPRVPNSPYGLCGREATSLKRNGHFVARSFSESE